MHRLDLGIYSYLKEVFLWSGVRTHLNSKGKIPPTRDAEGGGGGGGGVFELVICIKQDSKPNTLPTELFQLLMLVHKLKVCLL